MKTLYTCGIQIKPQVRGNLTSLVRQNESCGVGLRLSPVKMEGNSLKPSVGKV